MQADFNSSLLHSAKFKAIVFAARMERRRPAAFAKRSITVRIDDTPVVQCYIFSFLLESLCFWSPHLYGLDLRIEIQRKIF